MCYTYCVRFEWDPAKAATNKRKHGISFEEAAECFEDPLALLLEDSTLPERSILIGASRAGRAIFTVYVERDAALIRIVSARRSTSHERRAYEEGEI